MVGRSLTDPTLDAFDIDNLVLNDNVGDHFSTEEELEGERTWKGTLKLMWINKVSVCA